MMPAVYELSQETMDIIRLNDVSKELFHDATDRANLENYERATSEFVKRARKLSAMKKKYRKLLNKHVEQLRDVKTFAKYRKKSIMKIEKRIHEFFTVEVD